MPTLEELARQVATEQRTDAGTAAPTVQTSGGVPPALDPMAELARQVRDEQVKQDEIQRNLLSWRAANDTADAGKRADVLRYSAASGHAPSFVEQNLDAVKKQVDAEQVDWNEVAHRQPALVQFLTELPEATPLVRDDAANLGGIEWAIKAPFHAFLDAVQEQRTVARQFLEAQGLGGEENRQRIRELEAQFSNKDYGAEGFFQAGLIGTAKMIPFIVGDTVARVAGGALAAKLTAPAGAAVGAAVGAPAAGAGAAPGAVVGGAAGGITGAAVGQFIGSGLFNYYEAVGPLYWRLSNLKDSNGKLMDPAVARAFAQGGAVVTAGLMAGFMGKVGGQLPGVKQLLAKFGANTVEKALAEATTQQMVKTGLKRFGTHWLTGATMMAGQSAISAAAEESAKGASGQPFEVHWGNVTSAAKQGFEHGLQDMWLLSALGPGRQLLKDVGRARASAENAARLEAMTSSAEASKLLERFPEGFQKAVEQMKAEKGAVENVYIPAEEWTRYWQEQKVDPGQVAAAVVGDGGKAFAEAVRTKGDLAIPVDKYLKSLAKTEHAGPLQMDAKLRADELTPRQHQAEQKALKERLRQEAKVRGAELEQGKKEVLAFIEKQARAAGVSKAEAEANAKLVAEYAGTMALRLGLDVREAAVAGGLGQLRILGPKGEAVAQAARDAFQKWMRPSASRLLDERLGTMTAEGRAREYYLDQVSGLRNRRVFDAEPVPEGKQVAVITSPDVKGINDHATAGGHDVANELLRSMGKAIGEGHEEAARAGTSFLVHVADKAELDALVAKVKAELGNDKLNVVGELGGEVEAAFKALDATTDKLRTEKALPERGGLHPELDVAGLKFREGKAAGAVPQRLVEELGKLSNVEYAKRAYLDAVTVDGKRVETGLLTAEGWHAIPRKAHVASIDLKGLKAANEKYGKEWGNKMLLAFADVLAHFGGSSFDAAHLSGDEYALQHNDPLALDAFVKRLKPVLERLQLEAVDAATGKAELVSVDFRHGIGRDYGQADRALNAGKRAEAKLGAADQGPKDRPGDQRAERRRGDDAREAEGVPRGRGDVGAGSGAGAPGAGDLAAGDRRGSASSAPTQGRGAQRQGFGEVVAYFEGAPVTIKRRGGGGEGEGGAGGEDTSFDFGANVGRDVLREEADRYIGNMRDAEKKAYAEAWRRYTSGEGERPVPGKLALAKVREVERELARFGLVDPEGFVFDESGRDLSPMAGTRRGPNRAKGSTDPHVRRQERAGVGLSGAARENLERRMRGEAVFYEEGRDGGGPRGSIELQLDSTGRPVAFDIRLLNADRSTLAHETSHFLSWSLHDLATSDLTSVDLARDYGELLKWAGYKSVEERLASTKERAELGRREKRTEEQEARYKELSAKEERISHGWEQYLLEGKAPSRGLARVFARFKDWLLGIYKGVAGVQRQFREQYGQEIALSDDVRRLFDRLLAQDEALTQAREETGATLTPPPLVTSAMSPSEREAYRQALVNARAAAEREMQRTGAELEAERAGEARERIEIEVAAELDKQPVYRAMRYLQDGELVGPDGQVLKDTPVPDTLLDDKGRPYKLNRQAFVQTFGKDVARLMPSRIFDAVKKGGVEAEQLAPLLGFETGKALVDAFRSAEPRDRAVERRTQERLDEAFGPLHQRLAEAALAAVHTDAAARATLLELRGMAKQLGLSAAARVNAINLETLKDAAERLVLDTPVAELEPSRFARAERATALKAAELWGAGKKEEALEQKEARLFNQLLFGAARDARERLERARERIEKTSEAVRADLGKASPAYRDVHDAVAAAVGLGEAPKGVELAAPLDQLVRLADERAQQLEFDVDAVGELLKAPKEWEALTVEEAGNVADAITNLRHLARETLELKLGEQKQTREAWFKDFTEHLARRKPLEQLPFSKTAEGLGEKLKHLGRGADALLTDVAESYAHSLDAGDRAGPLHRLLVDARLEARAKSVELSKGVLKRILEAWENVPKDVRELGERRVDVGELLPVPPAARARFAPVYTRDTLWMLFLNWGNDGNRQRIRDGMGWTDDNVQKALSLLNPAELKFLQGVLDAVQSLYPELAAAHERRTGLRLEQVQATPITINGETYAGGYFPLKADARVSRVGEVQEGESIKSLFAPSYARPTVSAGHRKARQKRAAYAVDLTWGVVPAHLAQVIHDISYGDWVRQAGGILLDPRFKELVSQHLGPEREREFVPWLRDVANARADSAAGGQSEFLQQLGGWARHRAAVAVMGMNLPSLIGQVIDPWNSAQENVPPQHIAAAYVKVNAWKAGLIELPELQLSKELQFRDEMLKTNLREQLAKLGPGGKGLSRVVSEVSFALYELSDRYTTRVTWKAAWDKALSDGLSDTEAAARADDVVRRAYASHDIAEKPPLMRSKRGLAATVMFYGFANRLYNSLRRSATDVSLAFGRDEATTGDRVAAVSRLAAKLMMLGVTGAAFSYLSGRGPKKDEDVLRWLAWKTALEPFNTVPFVGGALELTVKGHRVNARTAPELSLMVDTLGRIGSSLEKIHSGSGGDEAKLIAGVEALIGAGLAIFPGAPLGQLSRTGGFAQDLATGEARPRNPLEAASGFVYGERKDQGRNPLSDLGELLR